MLARRVVDGKEEFKRFHEKIILVCKEEAVCNERSLREGRKGLVCKEEAVCNERSLREGRKVLVCKKEASRRKEEVLFCKIE